MIQCGSTNFMPTSMGNAKKKKKKNPISTIWIITTLIKPHDTHNSHKHPQISSVHKQNLS